MTGTQRELYIRAAENPLRREAKAEEKVVKQEVKRCSRLEEKVKKNERETENADKVLKKREKHERKTAKTVDEAQHKHDVAKTKLEAAKCTSELRHERLNAAKKALEQETTTVEQFIKDKEEHDRMREIKLAQIRQDLAPSPAPEPMVSLPGQRGPSVDNRGRPMGYGVDFNHTAVDSEGNALGFTSHDINRPWSGRIARGI